MILYHITKRKNLLSIFHQGILPALRQGINISGTKCKHVFLTNDPSHILQNQCGLKWAEKHDCVVLRIFADPNKIEPLRHYSGGTYTISEVEFTTDFIGKEQINGVLELDGVLDERVNMKVFSSARITTEGRMDGKWNIKIEGVNDADLHDVEVSILALFGKKKKKPMK